MTLLYSFLILNILGFALTAYDKKLAIGHKKRISEKTLLSVSAIGGSIGSAFAMYILRHKTSKWNFMWKFYSIVLLQIVIVITYYMQQQPIA